MFKANVSVDVAGGRSYHVFYGGSVDAIRARAKARHPGAFVFVGPLERRD